MTEEVYRTYVEVPNLENFGYGIRYFDDEHTIYVSTPVHQLIANQLLDKLTYFVLSYTRSQKPIDVVAQEIINELKRCVSGEATMDLVERILKEKQVFVNPDVVASPVMPTNLTTASE